jgi:aspartate aminotransferase-like enzyme
MLDKVDPEGLREFSVVYSDRSLNHMSHCFQQVMRDLSQGLKAVYRAYHTVLVPGSGTFAMEAVARQFATGRQCLVIRNGWFSYRWSQIFEMGQIPASETVLKARPVTAENDQPHRPFAPVALEEVLATIADQKPDVVFAPHVETSAGMRLPEAYLRAVAESVHQYGGLFVLDCIASGCDWVDMDSLGIDVLVSAPQKGWSSSPCCGVVMLSELAAGRLADSQSTSFACDLRKWRDIMAAYESGGHAYHATMPTDSLRVFRDTLLEMQSFGFDHLKAQQLALGQKVRAALTGKGLQSVAAPGFEAASVVVCFAPDGDWQSGANFKKLGIQIAAGVPLQCDEGDAFKTFRIGLFGLEKLAAVEEAADFLSNALNQLHGEGTPLA